MVAIEASAIVVDFPFAAAEQLADLSNFELAFRTPGGLLRGARRLEEMKAEFMSSAQRWLDDPRHVTLLVRLLVAVCALLLAAELFVDKHGHFAFEQDRQDLVAAANHLREAGNIELAKKVEQLAEQLERQ